MIHFFNFIFLNTHKSNKLNLINFLRVFKITALFIANINLINAQVETIGDDKYKMVINGSPLKIPYYANSSLEVSKNNYTNAVVSLHGIERNANDYYNTVLSAASLRSKLSDSTYMIAPQFLTEEDLVFHKLDQEHLYWTSGGWSSGSNSRSESTNPRPQRIASFAVMDSILLKIITTFPKIKSITLAGHSAGAQFINRYYASSPMIDDLCQKYKVSTKFIVANPSSYVYLNNKRVVSGTTDKFAVPVTSCTAYNEWRHGLDNLFTYPAAIGKEAIMTNFKSRNVAYLAGQLDNDPNAPNLGTTCEDRLQGAHRLERSIIYFNHLKDVYGQDILKTQSHDVIPNTGHNHFPIFTSEKALFHLFEAKPQQCRESITYSGDEGQMDELMVMPNPTNSFFTIKSHQTQGKISILDIHGKQILQTRLEELPENNLNTEFLQKGIYFLLLENKEYKSYLRFIKV